MLASGSSGNAALLEIDRFGVLLDAGLGPRLLASRMKAVGLGWERVHVALLTHTHGDHWKERTFSHFRRRRIFLHCHPAHHAALSTYSMAFCKLHDERLVRAFERDAELILNPCVRCRALPLPHDAGATFGFRFDCRSDVDGAAFSLGYVADLGTWDLELARGLANTDILAIEFNHDVDMEYASGRSADLIARVLGDHGHLSNRQAAALLREVIRLSDPGRLKHVVQLHLSRECNRPDLALRAAREVLPEEVKLHTAHQDWPGPCLSLGDGAEPCSAPRPAPAPLMRQRSLVPVQSWLPGWET
jgi:phosphoribosyl 1,2-cyclic phosphodiesterase